MGPEQQSMLIEFAEDHFASLPTACIREFKNQAKLPGKGQVVNEDDIISLKLTLSLSLLKSHATYIETGENLAEQLAEMFTGEYLMHLNELFLELLTNKELAINTSIEQLIKYCKMEKSPIIIVSPEVSTVLEKHRSFIPSNIDEADIDYLNFYEFGKIRNVKIVVDPLQINPHYAYLITGNVIDYIIRPNEEAENFINYELSQDGRDLTGLFSPVILQYKADQTGLNFKFFNIIEQHI